MEKIITISYKLESNEDVDKCDREIFETIKECGLMFHDGGYNTQNQMRDLRFKYESPESPKAMIAEGLDCHSCDNIVDLDYTSQEAFCGWDDKELYPTECEGFCKQDKPKGGSDE